MTWLGDVKQALVNLGGEARWSQIVEETLRIREKKKASIPMMYNLRINYALNENRDGKGKDPHQVARSRRKHSISFPDGQR